MSEQHPRSDPFLSHEATSCLLMGVDMLFQQLESGEKGWIDEHRFWIRLNGIKPFPNKFYLIDTRFKWPSGYGDEYLVFCDGWELPEVGHVYSDPGQNQKHGSQGYTIRLPREAEDIFLHMPITPEEKKSKILDWCLGGVTNTVKSI